MEAVILAGGQGSRLRPLTAEIPKPLVTVGGRPVIEILLLRLQRAGVTKAHLAVNHLAHLIMAAVGDGSKFGLSVNYSQEPTPLGTIGPLRLIDDLPETFIVANGDILTDLDFSKLYQCHQQDSARLTVATVQRSSRVDYGVLEVDNDRRVTAFREKPEHQLTVSAGIYVFDRSLLQQVPPDRPFGFDELVLNMLKSGEAINTFPFDGYWMDIGRLEDYEQANNDSDRISDLLG
jgi:NDP-sugar pyrophosphorylase family protein